MEPDSHLCEAQGAFMPLRVLMCLSADGVKHKCERRPSANALSNNGTGRDKFKIGGGRDVFSSQRHLLGRGQLLLPTAPTSQREMENIFTL